MKCQPEPQVFSHKNNIYIYIHYSMYMFKLDIYSLSTHDPVLKNCLSKDILW